MLPLEMVALTLLTPVKDLKEQDRYDGYKSALELCNLETLSTRREKRCLNFGLKALKHPKHKKIFPINEEIDIKIRELEKFHVNFARTSTYKKSSIPYIQRLLNKHHINKLYWL